VVVSFNKKEKTLKFYNKQDGLVTQNDNVNFDFFCQGVVNIG